MIEKVMTHSSQQSCSRPREGIRALALALALLGGGLFAGCTTTQTGMAVGGASGAALGGIIGHQVGHTTSGALIGAGAGAVTGGLVGEGMAKKFCPTCGRSFTASREYCPVDGTELRRKTK